jgi:hypothetical protein
MCRPDSGVEEELGLLALVCDGLRDEGRYKVDARELSMLEFVADSKRGRFDLVRQDSSGICHTRIFKPNSKLYLQSRAIKIKELERKKCPSSMLNVASGSR